MAFDRTERFARVARSTPARVGPGTYDVSDPSKPSRDPGNLQCATFANSSVKLAFACVAYAITLHRLCSTDNAYPFLSGASRQTLGIPKDAHKFPGPGSYNIEAPRERIPERAFSLFMPHLFAILPHRHTREYSISSDIQ